MGASKKQRGKQRKAKKSKAAESGILDIHPSQISPKNLVALIQRGDHIATSVYSTGCGILSRTQTDKVVSSVLGYLQRCEETFDNVLADGDLKCPSIWINTLYRACESTSMDPHVCLQIAQSIGPLVKCMCDDKKMLFFQSKQHWIEALTSFVGLIRHILYEVTTCKLAITGALLNHEGLLRSIVQWSHIDSRPDITSMLDEHKCDIIYNCGRHSTHRLVMDLPNLREVIASTPTINKDYDPNSKISHIAGMITQLKTRGWEGNDFQILHHLIVGADCVDRGVIEGIIDFGLDLISNDPELSADTAITISAHVTNISRAMIHHDGGSPMRKGSPSDTRVAFAIRVGLIDMCLSLMGRFGGQAYIEHAITPNLFQYVHDALDAIHDVALHKKTWKAIRHKRPDIEDKLEQLDTSIINNVKCKELLDMVKSILDINGACCCHCNKSLGRKERFQCGECNRMTYCSRSCQRSDWLNGHSHACCRAYSGATIGQFQGRIIPTTILEDERAAAKLKELEINNNMIQLKLFLDHSSTILDQAKSLNMPLCDCFVKFELRHCPPKVTTCHFTDLYSDEAEGNLFEASRSEKNIHCMFYSYNFTGDSSLCLGEPTTMLGMQRLFPCEWLTQKK